MDTPLLQATVESVQRGQERFWQMLRREMQQFDEVRRAVLQRQLCAAEAPPIADGLPPSAQAFCKAWLAARSVNLRRTTI